MRGFAATIAGRRGGLLAQAFVIRLSNPQERSLTMTSYLLMGCVILFSHFLEGITGFGCTVLALPFAIMLVGTKQAVPVLMSLALMLALYIVIVSRKKIVWPEYFKIIGFASLGLPIGMATFSYVNESVLKAILGVFMVVVSLRGLLSFVVNLNETKLPQWVLNTLLAVGGFIHGVFSSGGPLVVIYARKALPDKSNFRATVSLLWLTLNTVMLTQGVISGRMTPEILEIIAVCVPFFIVGALSGNWAHTHIKDRYFSQIVYVVLLISGLFMFK
jgi:uncharacterized membrane protein YfcA